MTYKEYVEVAIGKFGLTESEIEFLLTEADLDPYATVTDSTSRALLKTAMYKHIPLMVAGLSSVSEGGFSMSWNIEGIKLWYSLLAKELGLEDLMSTRPKIRDKSYVW